MSVYMDPIFSCRTVLEYSCKNLHFQNYLKIVDSSTFGFFLPKWVIFQVALRHRPPQFRLCNLYVVRLLNSKVELEVAPFAGAT